MPDSPVLTEHSGGEWTTTIVVGNSPLCLDKLTFWLVTTPGHELVKGDVLPGKPTGVPYPAAGPCGQRTGQDTRATISFTLPRVPLGATLMVDQFDKTAVPTTIPLALQRQVTGTQYFLVPAICGFGLALLVVLAMAMALARVAKVAGGTRGAVRKQRFWRRPLYASAAWSFKDSWATNITSVGGGVAAILGATAPAGSVLPGVQLDRFAILLAFCGAITLTAPLVFSIVNALCAGAHRMVPDGAHIHLGGAAATIVVPDGASLSPAGDSGKASAGNGAAAKELISPDSEITIHKVLISLLGDTTVLIGPSRVLLGPQKVLIIPAGEEPGAPEDAMKETTVGADGAILDVVGVADVTLPRGTKAGRTTYRSQTLFQVPPGTNVFAADMRSLIPAAVVTMFGVGAELGIIGVLAYGLNTASGLVRGIALLILLGMAAIVVAYAYATTRMLADTTPGSALAGTDATSFTF